jgi:hypothetical protein
VTATGPPRRDRRRHGGGVRAASCPRARLHPRRGGARRDTRAPPPSRAWRLPPVCHLLLASRAAFTVRRRGGDPRHSSRFLRFSARTHRARAAVLFSGLSVAPLTASPRRIVQVSGEIGSDGRFVHPVRRGGRHRCLPACRPTTPDPELVLSAAPVQARNGRRVQSDGRCR